VTTGEAPSGESPRASAEERSEATKAAVNLLDARERRLGIIATVAELLLTAFVTIPYLLHHHKFSANELKTNGAVHVFLIEGLVLGAILLLGTLLKRRALLGFSSLLVGLWLLQVKALFVMGFAYLGFGMWLVVKGFQRSNKGGRGAARSSGRRAAEKTAPRSGRSSGASSAGRSAPKPNKRYTPPKATSRPAPKKPPARAEPPKG